ncbi:hypothetical protein ACPCSP_25415 [Streptomyces cinereoruber]|uniref:hypothetical protein n=1 Tax=Streptomyces cinereoruber TaxID=67260 RepID=UPI003C2D06FE
MGCGCNKSTGAGSARKSYTVVAINGQIVYGPTSSEDTAKAVSKRYPDSEVKEIAPQAPARR